MDCPGAAILSLFFRRSDHDVAKGHVSVFTSLQIDRPWQAFLTIERAAGDARDFLMIDNRLAVLHYGDPSSDQGNVKGLPLVRLADRLRARSQKSINPTGALIWRLPARIGFDLHFIAPPQVHPAVGIWSAVKFHMQLEIAKFRVRNQFGAAPRTD